MAAGAFLPRPRAVAVAAAVVAADAALALALVHGGLRDALLVVLLPLLVVGGIALASNAHVLAFVALALPMTQHKLNVPQQFGGTAIWTSDIVCGLAVVAWFARRLRQDENPPRWDTPAILGWPFVPFAIVLFVAELRGHYAWGESLIGQPLRFFLYAVVAVLIVGLDAQRALKGITAVFYLGTVWMMLNAVYYVATGTSQTMQVDLSTGGSRYLSGTVSEYMAAALCLALLNLQLEKTARERALHVSIAVLAFFGVVLAETRATFAAVAVVLPFILFARRVRGPLLSVLPLALPFLILVAIAIHQVEPQLVPDLVDRVTRTNAQDPNVAWRLKVDHASLQQFWSSPLYGVGFGKTATISVLLPTGSLGLMLSQEQTVGQGAHDAYLWMLAGGGLSVLIPYLLLLAVFFWDSWRRFRGATDLHERVLLAWCMAAVACFAIPEVSSPPWDATQLIGFWVILLLPGIVPRRELRATTPGRAPGGARARRPARR